MEKNNIEVIDKLGKKCSVCQEETWKIVNPESIVDHQRLRCGECNAETFRLSYLKPLYFP